MRRASSLMAAVPLALVLLAASCGGEVINNTTAAAASGSSSAGGASGTSSATGSTGSGGAHPASCGGKAGVPCSPDAFCQFDPAASCGNFDAPGTCQPRPSACDLDCPGVCGCNGKFYCNDCVANAAGVDVSNDMACKINDSYRAINLFTNVPRYAILKASPTRNLCFRLTAEVSASLGIGIFGDGFAVKQAEVTNDASDCNVGPGALPPAKGASYPVASGSGALTFLMVPGGCVAGIHAKVMPAGAPPWAPSVEPLDADGLIIEGGCP